MLALDSDGELPPTYVFDLSLSPADPERVYVLAVRPLGPYTAQWRPLRSDDGGETWVELAAEAPPKPHAVVTDRYLPRRAWLAAASQVWRTDDGGASWVSVAALWVADLAVAANGDLLALAGFGPSEGPRVLRSSDGGFTWAQVGEVLPWWSYADRLVAHDSEDTVWVLGAGVFERRVPPGP